MKKRKKKKTCFQEFRDIFMTKLEPLTDQLIDELVTKQNWEKDQLIQFKTMGLSYNRVRNSFMQDMI